MNSSASPSDVARPSTFWLGVAAVAVVSALSARGGELSDFAGFGLIVGTGLLPAALWCWRRTWGLPIFPLFALGTIGTFGLPLLARHPLVIEYSPRERFDAALIIAATNLAGTAVWYLLTRSLPRPRSRRPFALRPEIGPFAFGVVLVAAVIFNLLQTGLSPQLDPSLFSVLRAAIIALSNLALFLLAHLWGRGRLSVWERLVYGPLIIAVMISTLPSALMVGALGYGLLALIGYALGRGRVPWLPLAGLAAVALFLQGGKEDLRDKYWYSAQAGPISLADYPGMLADWVRFSLAHAGGTSEPSPAPSGTDTQSLVDRVSLLHLFLRIQRMSPDPVPYLHGRTYAVVPELLVPRVFNADKARAHLGTYMLAIHYDLQTTEDTLTTTIGFGLINEALANFGPAGCVALGLGLGIFYGLVARWSAGSPLFSLRSILSILVLSVAFQNEFTVGVYITTLFQGACVILALAPLIMCRTSPSRIVLSRLTLTGVPA